MLDGLARKLASQNVVVVGILVDPDRIGARDVLAREHIGYPQLDDESGAAARAFSIESLPTLVVIDRAGVVRSFRTGFAPEEDVEAAIRRGM